MSTQKIISPDIAGYWIGEVRQDKFAEGQPAIVFLPGIGESGQRLNLQYAKHDYKYTEQGSEEATAEVLKRITSWCGTASLIAATDWFGFNLVTVSARHEYENGEIFAAIKYAREVLKASRVTILSNSLGGYGLFKEIGKHAELPGLVDAIVSLVSGPGVGSDTAKHIADAKTPIWILTVENDTASGTNPTVSIKMHSDILAAGSKSYLTVYKTGIWTNSDAHQLYFRVIPAWFSSKAPGNVSLTQYATTGAPLGKAGIINLVTEPKMSIYDFLLHVPTNPSMTSDEQKPQDIPLPQPIPEPQPVPQPIPAPAPPKPKSVYPVSFYLITDKTVAGKIYLDVNWEDGSPFKRYTFFPTDRFKAAYMHDIAGHKTISVEFYNTEVPGIFIDRKPL